MKNLISVDLEDWYTSAYLVDHVRDDQIVSRIEEATYPILRLFERKKIHATFFVLGSIAKKYPALIRDIAHAGHEIASHGYSHTPLWKLTPDSFREEIQKTNYIIEGILGHKPIGFRAPLASLDKRTAWAISVLEEEGFIYDSSIFPMATPLYGAPGAPMQMYKISAANLYHHEPQAKIFEVPFTVACWGHLKIPCTGGIYGRFLPYWFLKRLFQRARKNGPVNFYFHPWETYPEIPRLDVPFINKIISYGNVDSYLQKIEGLLDCAEYCSFKENECFEGELQHDIRR
jgi:peptidoglycan-N-acetylglucosamine deacetylase